MAGCVSFSGIMAGRSYLMRHHLSTPNTLLIHGDADNLVRFEALDFTKNMLSEMGAAVETKVIPGGMHQITPEGLEYAADFIERNSFHKKS